jgi:hypothetical protein
MSIRITVPAACAAWDAESPEETAVVLAAAPAAAAAAVTVPPPLMTAAAAAEAVGKRAKDGVCTFRAPSNHTRDKYDPDADGKLICGAFATEADRTSAWEGDDPST